MAVIRASTGRLAPRLPCSSCALMEVAWLFDGGPCADVVCGCSDEEVRPRREVLRDWSWTPCFEELRLSWRICDWNGLNMQAQRHGRIYRDMYRRCKNSIVGAQRCICGSTLRLCGHAPTQWETLYTVGGQYYVGHDSAGDGLAPGACGRSRDIFNRDEPAQIQLKRKDGQAFALE